MNDDEQSLAEYVRQVHEQTRQYLHALIEENTKAVALVRSQEAELEHYRKQSKQLAEQLVALDAEHREHVAQYAAIEEQNATVSNLYVATLRLHGSIARHEVVQAIQEIVINLIGSEELALFELEADGERMRLTSHFGIDPEPLAVVRVGAGIIGGCAQSGHSYVKGEPTDLHPLPLEKNMTACIPLSVEGVVIGVVAIFALLEHKPHLEPGDHELFTLLSSHAARALYCTTFVEQAGGRRSLHVRARSTAPSSL